MVSLAVVILTHNEERHIGRAIDAVRPLAKEILIVDSGSTDRTIEIARSKGAVVLLNPWTNYSRQFQWALDNGSITADWIMRLDADEVIEDKLASEIADKLDKLPRDVVGVNLKRKHIFLGRWIRFGGRYPLILTRIWRRGSGRIEDRWMDEHIIVSGGRTITFEHPFSDQNLNDIGFFTDKHNKYATREAVDVLIKKHSLFEGDDQILQDRSSIQASLKRFIKEKIYNNIPFQFSSFGYFIFRYFFQLGLLDGREGLIYHFLQGGWYRFLVGAKVYEFDLELRALTSIEEKRKVLAKLSGLKLDLSAPKVEHVRPSTN
ncbi:glycosyltransferase family 2 protein [Oryzifoliimicrobium ureilyticus]|uniref:glycosyltransferase family 2 protein n=1 Tax=Oryzifoliimicrobium ureilyticus TaxID=3113724 RepID=UPI0030761299